jgi:transglutaminase-like putative cysteine protease
MRFTIRHSTQYRYSQPVQLGPQQLRFHPREDGAQRVIDHRMEISPRPLGRNEHIDLEGNRVTQAWFGADTDHLDITVTMQVETLRSDPFDFVLDPGAACLPVEHSPEEVCARAYLKRFEAEDTVTAFANELSLAVERDTLRFVDRLNHELFGNFEHVLRETGTPQTPAVTLQSRRGACRDLAVLFVDCCRTEGLAARFASGYQKGDLQSERRHLHAWPEVFLPGAGWRGYDPTHGLAVADTHVTVAAAAHPRDTMPVSGIFSGNGASSSLDYRLRIEVAEASTR